MFRFRQYQPNGKVQAQLSGSMSGYMKTLRQAADLKGGAFTCFIG